VVRLLLLRGRGDVLRAHLDVVEVHRLDRWALMCNYLRDDRLVLGLQDHLHDFVTLRSELSLSRHYLGAGLV